jgi:hypothetical protein
VGESREPEPPDREPEPPDWELEPPDWPDLVAGAASPVGDVGLAGAVGPGETEPPLPVDPFPDWAPFIAA